MHYCTRVLVGGRAERARAERWRGHNLAARRCRVAVLPLSPALPGEARSKVAAAGAADGTRDGALVIISQDGLPRAGAAPRRSPAPPLLLDRPPLPRRSHGRPSRAYDPAVCADRGDLDVQVRLTIGDFARMTHLSVKALHHYHDQGLLVPADIDRWTGYR